MDGRSKKKDRDSPGFGSDKLSRKMHLKERIESRRDLLAIIDLYFRTAGLMLCDKIGDRRFLFSISSTKKKSE